MSLLFSVLINRGMEDSVSHLSFRDSDREIKSDVDFSVCNKFIKSVLLCPGDEFKFIKSGNGMEDGTDVFIVLTD